MDQYHRLKVNQWIDGHRFDKYFVIDDRYYCICSQHDQQYRSIVSVSTHRSIPDCAQLCLHPLQEAIRIAGLDRMAAIHERHHDTTFMKEQL